MSQADVLSQSFELGFTYTRSVGPVVGRFLPAMKQRQILGIRGSDGRVLVPPVEFDPVSAEALSEFVPVASEGTVASWSWVYHPRDSHPLAHPFAWAFILLDGADTPLLHCVDARSPEVLHTGVRVIARWVDEPCGHIRDIRCFTPVPEVADG